ncbi:hypothetical protein PFISCL1PPCAC_9931, partial [Pristionchus fissidentatus]
MVVLVIALVSMHSRISIPLYICAVLMTLWSVYFVFISAFLTISAIYAAYNFEQEMARIRGGERWDGGIAAPDNLYWPESLIAALAVALVYVVIFLVLTYIHDKTADALVAIGRCNGCEDPMVPVTRGGVSEWIHGERTVTKTVTEST